MSAQSQALPSTSPANAGMAVSQFENPMGIDGFEFVEFAAPAGRGGARSATASARPSGSAASRRKSKMVRTSSPVSATSIVSR